METQNNDQRRYREAQKQVKKIKGFYVHLSIYILVSIMLFTINMIYSPHHIWFIWNLMGWGIGVTIHGLSAFNQKTPFLGKDWEEKKIQEIIKKNRNHEQYE